MVYLPLLCHDLNPERVCCQTRLICQTYETIWSVAQYIQQMLQHANFCSNSLILLFSLHESEKISRLLMQVPIDNRSVAIEFIVLQNCAPRFSVHLKKEEKYLVLRSDQVREMNLSVNWHRNAYISADNYQRGGIFHDRCGRLLTLYPKDAKPDTNCFVVDDITIRTQLTNFPQHQTSPLLLVA